MLELAFDTKDTFALLGMVLGAISFFPYFIDIYKKRTTPHAYTWLIWSITQGIATAGLLMGGAGLTALGLLFGTILSGIIFLLSFKYGTRNVKPVDTVALVAALVGIIVWWQLDAPILAIFLAALIDVLGYLPTYRKLFEEPCTENILSWTLFTVSYLFALLALREYNLLTVPYLVIIMAANVVLVVIGILRRTKIICPA